MHKALAGITDIKAIRWASDRIGDEGIIAFISNNSFVDEFSLDGVRKHLSRDFNSIYVLDLKGNIRKDSMIDGIPLGEKHTIFGLAAMVGVAITFLIRNKRNDNFKIFHSSVDFRATRIEKFSLIEKYKTIYNIKWASIIPNEKNFWLNEKIDINFVNFISIGKKGTKFRDNENIVFRNYGSGIATCRDPWIYNFNPNNASKNFKLII